MERTRRRRGIKTWKKFLEIDVNLWRKLLSALQISWLRFVYSSILQGQYHKLVLVRPFVHAVVKFQLIKELNRTRAVNTRGSTCSMDLFIVALKATWMSLYPLASKETTPFPDQQHEWWRFIVWRMELTFTYHYKSIATFHHSSTHMYPSSAEHWIRFVIWAPETFVVILKRQPILSLLVHPFFTTELLSNCNSLQPIARNFFWKERTIVRNVSDWWRYHCKFPVLHALHPYGLSINTLWDFCNFKGTPCWKFI